MLKSLLCFLAAFSATSAVAAPRARNVILLIPDGTSHAAFSLARWVDGGAPFVFDKFVSGAVRTYSANSPITDSAAAASAMATSYKTWGGYISVLPERNEMWGLPVLPKGSLGVPRATVLEAARLAGKSVGLVVTSEIYHATPAAFSGHSRSRNSKDDLAEQQVHARLDVALGGGAEGFDKSKRSDGADLKGKIESLGYTFVSTRDELLAAPQGKKIWGAFAKSDLPYDRDRDPHLVPSLAEMTDAALSRLSKNPKGFFLMVEGSKVDLAAHASDVVGVVSEVLGFERAARAAFAFARKNPDTLIIMAPDHNTGGLAFSNVATGFEEMPLSEFVDVVKGAKRTVTHTARLIAREPEKMDALIAENLGIGALTPQEKETLMKEATTGLFANALGSLFAARGHLAWATRGHTGEDVPFACVRAGVRCSLQGVISNTEIGDYMAREMGVDLEAATRRLYTDAIAGFSRRGASVSVDESEAANPVLRVEKAGRRVLFPANCNSAKVDGKEIPLEGYVVIDGARAWVPASALALLDGR